jgi:predicted enzyme related to lactoylglutathione lyase/uncharacterized protein YndB with AHSA1/START domain
MSTTTAPELTLKISRFIKAPRKRVFDAWTRPDDLMRWMGPGRSYLITATTDLRVGGEYHMKMKAYCHTNQQGEIVDVSGVYKEVKPHSRLSFTWGWTDEVDRINDTLVTLDFAEADGGTQFTLTHTGFRDEESRDGHNQGWCGTIDKLEKLSQMSVCSTPGTFSWNELVTSDTAAAKTFYTKLFEWETSTMEMPTGGQYTIFRRGGEIGGMMQCPAPGMPSHWLPYITVENVDESAASAVKLGGEIVVDPMDIHVGRIAVIVDPQGAAFGLFKPAPME